MENTTELNRKVADVVQKNTYCHETESFQYRIFILIKKFF
jgi:hypothetical protein